MVMLLMESSASEVVPQKKETGQNYLCGRFPLLYKLFSFFKIRIIFNKNLLILYAA